MPSADGGRRGADAPFEIAFAAIRALARLVGPVSAWITKVRTAMARARSVEERWTFVLGELSGTETPACYHLRPSGTALCLRHGTPDVYIFDEVFREGLYDFPPPVAAALESAGPNLRVVDLGGHIGLFGVYLRSRYPAARITAFEPDPESGALLERVIAENGAAESWSLVRACALDHEDVVEFEAGQNSESRLAPSDADGTIRVPAVDVLPVLESADFVKLDIEGSEWPILADPRFAGLPTRAAVLEYHPHMAPGDDARAAAVGLLRSAGFQTSPIFHAPAGHGMLWAWRTGDNGA